MIYSVTGASCDIVPAECCSLQQHLATRSDPSAARKEKTHCHFQMNHRM